VIHPERAGIPYKKLESLDMAHIVFQDQIVTEIIKIKESN
jgi:hypothetical protein